MEEPLRRRQSSIEEQEHNVAVREELEKRIDDYHKDKGSSVSVVSSKHVQLGADSTLYYFLYFVFYHPIIPCRHVSSCRCAQSYS